MAWIAKRLAEFGIDPVKAYPGFTFTEDNIVDEEFSKRGLPIVNKEAVSTDQNIASEIESPKTLPSKPALLRRICERILLGIR